mgnify:CR=1 FL=1
MKNTLLKVICLILIISLTAPFSTAYCEIKNQDTGKYIIYVDLYAYTLTLFDKEIQEPVKTYPVAIGKKYTPSPIGTWQIKSKALMNGPFGGYWLGLNAPWDTFGIHGTSNPSSIGSMASNGCIRLFNNNIKELFSLVDYNTIVVVSGGPNWMFSPYYRIMFLNDKGADVYHVERILNALGYYPKEPDGIYDYDLYLAVMKYKKDHDISGSDEIDQEFLDSIGCPKFE